MDYHLLANGLVGFRDKIHVSDESELKKLILRYFHVNPYSVHPRYQKILTIVKTLYYWPNLRKEVEEFTARCLDSQKVKEECKHPIGLLQPIMILEWKWEVISMDFITGLLRTSKQHDSIMVVVDRLSKLTHLIAVKYTNSAS